MPTSRATPGPDRSATSSRRGLAAAFFSLWFAATSLFGAWAMAQHVLPLPAARPAAVAPAGSPTAWHVLGSDCGCSASISRDLARSGPAAGWREQVWLVGDEPGIARELRAAGFAVERIVPELLARQHGIKGAPWLVLFDATGQVAYSGGYSSGRPGVGNAVNEAARLRAAVAAGRIAASLPAYGCATSEDLRQRLDPLGFKYPSAP